MTLYSDSAHQPSVAIDALHSDEMQSFAQTGTWGSAAQRTAVAATVRKIRVEAGSQVSVGDEHLADLVELPAPVLRLVREAALGGIAVDRQFCEQVQAEGVTEGAYVEIVTLVARIVNLDIFARGLGVPSRQLVVPAQDNSPSFKRPDEAADEGFFTASIPNLPAGGATAEALYGKNPAANVFRAATLVPEEGKRVIDLISQQYFPAEKLMDFGSDNGHALSRAQVEIVATKVSEYNKCFY